MARFKNTHDLAQGYPFGRPGEPETSTCSALRRYESALAQFAHDLGQVMARDGEFARDLVRCERALWLASEPHERA